MTGFANFVSEKENGICIWGAGNRERPAGKEWEGLGYGFEWLEEGLIGLEMCGDEFL